MDCPIPGLRQQHRAVRDQQRQDRGGIELRSSQPKWLDDIRRLRLGLELEQLRPFLGPQRLRNIQAIGWLFRNMDGVETIASMPVFQGSARL